jgi:hypothetical protein
MKRLSSTALVLLFAFAMMATFNSSASAATAALNYLKVGSNLDMGVTVTMSSSQSYWSKVDYHCNGGGSTRYRPKSVGFYYGPGTFTTSTSPDEWEHFNSLPNGNYTLYAIASGVRMDVFPYQNWYASTGDTNLTIP